MRKYRNCIFVFLLLSFCVVGQRFAFLMLVKGSSQSLSAMSGDDTDIIVLPGEIREYKDGSFPINGSIVVLGGRLVLQNATLNILQSRAFQYNLTFTDGFLEASNSKLASEYGFNIYFYGESFLKASRLDSGLGRLFFRDNSKADLTRFSGRGFLRAYNSTVLNIADSTLNPALGDLRKEMAVLETRDSSIVSISRTSIREISTYDASTASISDSQILSAFLPLSVSNSSKLTLGNSQGQMSIESHDFASILIFGTSFKLLSAFDNSLVSLIDSTITQGLSAYGLSQVFVQNSRFAQQASLSAYLATYDSSVAWVFGTKVKGLFSTNGASKVSVTSSVIESLNVDDSSSATFSASQIASLYASGGHSKIYLSSSNVSSLNIFASSYLSLEGSSVTLLHAHESSTVSAAQSTIEAVYIYNLGVNGSLDNLKLGRVTRWNYHVNSSIAIAQGGYAPNITLANSEIKVGWNFIFANSPNVNITDSTLDDLELSGPSFVRLKGSSISSYEISPGGTMQVYWHLQVAGPSNATITVSDSSGTIVESRKTDVSGLATFLLMEKVEDATETRSMNSYTLDVSSEGFSTSQKIEMTSNQEIVLLPQAPVWLQYWYIVVAFVIAVVAISIALYYVMKKRRRQK